MANAGHRRRRKFSVDEPLKISTSPSKWPGVTNLRALLAREKDEDIPRLNVLLTEAFVATYIALFIYALSACDCHILYRIAGQTFSDLSWATLYGGGVKKLLRNPTKSMQQSVQTQIQKEEGVESPTNETGSWSQVKLPLMIIYMNL